MHETLKRQLLAVAEEVKEASLLLKAGFQLRHPALFEEACEICGSWEAVLAELVIAMRDKEQWLAAGEAQEASSSASAVVVPPRNRSLDADDGVLGWTTHDELYVFSGDRLPLDYRPYTVETPDAVSVVRQFLYEGKPSDLIVFSQTGLYFGVVQDFVPQASAPDELPLLSKRFELPSGDKLFAALSRRQFLQGSDRLLHVTKQAKGKATSISEYALQFGKQGREAFLLKDDDLPIAVMIGREYNGLFCASAMGQGIHMDTTDIRTMGRKSVGVNLMKLESEDDAVVSAFLTEGISEIAMVTEQGYGKRLAFREFRRQGRGGAGYQMTRLNPQDRVIGVVPVIEYNDLVMTTNQGRVMRVPALFFPEMGRSARGKRIFELLSDETILSLSALPCGGNLPESDASASEPSALD